MIQWGEVAAERLAPTMEWIAELLVASPLQHGDETGIRIYGVLHWLHVNCTRFLTHLAWHESRGKPAMNEIGIWPRFAGRGMHDRLASYDAYGSAHSLCGPHLLRDCAAVAEQEQQSWATEMHDFLLDAHAAWQQWRASEHTSLSSIERDEWVARYFEILAAGIGSATSSFPRKKRQRQAQTKQGQKLAGCSAGACGSSPGLPRRSATSF